MAMHSSFPGFKDEYEFQDEESEPSEKELHMEKGSDSGTDDASETDMMKMEEQFTEIKEQMYQDKLASLKRQLRQLKEGTHTEYNRRLKRLDVQNRERIRLAEVFHTYALGAIEKEYINEKKAAVKEFDEKKVELRVNLIAELEEKKKIVESERQTMELTGDSMEVKPVNTRKLRRRPHDPPPLTNKIRKNNGVNQLNLLLNDSDVLEDLKVINKGKNVSSTTAKKNSNDSQSDIKIEDGKLYYEKKWYHRGNAIFLEGKDIGKISAVISGIGTNELWVKKLTDSSKMKVFLSQLSKGKYSIRRRTN